MYCFHTVNSHLSGCNELKTLPAVVQPMRLTNDIYSGILLKIVVVSVEHDLYLISYFYSVAFPRINPHWKPQLGSAKQLQNLGGRVSTGHELSLDVTFLMSCVCTSHLVFHTVTQQLQVMSLRRSEENIKVWGLAHQYHPSMLMSLLIKTWKQHHRLSSICKKTKTKHPLW